jgi:hypothetical protein
MDLATLAFLQRLLWMRGRLPHFIILHS